MDPIHILQTTALRDGGCAVRGSAVHVDVARPQMLRARKYTGCWKRPVACQPTARNLGEWKTRGRKERQALKDPAGRRDGGGPRGGRETVSHPQAGGRAAPHLALCHLISRHRLSSPLFLEPLSLFPQASPTTEAQDLKEARGIVTNYWCAQT